MLNIVMCTSLSALLQTAREREVALVLNGADVSFIHGFIHQSVELSRIANSHLHQPTYEKTRISNDSNINMLSQSNTSLIRVLFSSHKAKRNQVHTMKQKESEDRARLHQNLSPAHVEGALTARKMIKACRTSD